MFSEKKTTTITIGTKIYAGKLESIIKIFEITVTKLVR